MKQTVGDREGARSPVNVEEARILRIKGSVRLPQASVKAPGPPG